MKPFRHIAVVLGTALLLTACGGSGTQEAAETAQQREDRTASASIEGLMALVRAMVGGSTEQAEPRPVGGITPPASDSAEPQKL